MSTPTQVTTITTDAAALVTQQFVDDPVLQGLLKTWTCRLQILEDAFYGIINARKFDTAVNDQLDQWGAVVNEPRNGRVDNVYRVAIAIRIVVNKSRGRAEDVIRVTQLATSGDVFYHEPIQPMRFFVEAYELSAPATLAVLLSKTRMQGSNGQLLSSTWDTSENIVFTDGGDPHGLALFGVAFADGGDGGSVSTWRGVHVDAAQL